MYRMLLNSVIGQLQQKMLKKMDETGDGELERLGK